MKTKIIEIRYSMDKIHEVCGGKMIRSFGILDVSCNPMIFEGIIECKIHKDESKKEIKGTN
jgi:hypothetical protein